MSILFAYLKNWGIDAEQKRNLGLVVDVVKNTEGIKENRLQNRFQASRLGEEGSD